MGNKIILQDGRNGQKSQTNNNKIDELCSLYSWLVQEWIKHTALASIYPMGTEAKVKHLTMAKMAETWRFELERRGQIRIGE